MKKLILILGIIVTIIFVRIIIKGTNLNNKNDSQP